MINRGYVISYDARGRPERIQHLACGVTSWNRNDIKHLYCACCHQFMDLYAFEDWQGMFKAVELARSAERGTDSDNDDDEEAKE